MRDKNDTSSFQDEITVMEINKIEGKIEGKYYSIFIDSGLRSHEFMLLKKFKLQQ